MTRTKTLTHTLLELPTGWLHKEWGVVYATATAARRALKHYETKLVKDGIEIVVSQRSWEPTTPTGTLIVRALEDLQGT